MRTTVALSALALLLLVTGLAMAVPRTGAVDDPQDSRPPFEGTTFPDASRVMVSYEPDDGTLIATLTLIAPLGSTASPSASTFVDLTFGVGASGPGGACAVPDLAGDGRPGDLRVAANIDSNGPPDDITNQFRTTVQVVGGPQFVGAAGSISADRRVITWTVAADPALAGRDLHCVGDVAMPYSFSDSDAIADFPLTGPAGPAAPAPPAPAPAPSAVAPPAVAAATTPDRVAPRLRLAPVTRTVRALRRGGLTARVACDEPCAVRARLRLAPRVARALGVSRLLGASTRPRLVDRKSVV